MQKLELKEFKEYLKNGYSIVDTRTTELFCEGFISESVSIPYSENFIHALQDLTTEEQKILFISDKKDVLSLSGSIRFSNINNIAGFLSGGIEAWTNAGNRLDMLITIEADEFAMDYKFDEFYLIDVRNKEEFEKEHVEDSANVALNDLEQVLIDLEPASSHYVYGNSISDAVTAGSLLKKMGFERTRVVASDYEAIKTSEIPIFKKKKETMSGKKS